MRLLSKVTSDERHISIICLMLSRYCACCTKKAGVKRRTRDIAVRTPVLPLPLPCIRITSATLPHRNLHNVPILE